MHITYRWEMRPVGAPGHRIKWFDHQGNHPVTASALGYPTPTGWDKTVEAVLAHHASTHLALGRAAQKIYRKAQMRLLAHRDTGSAKVGISHGSLDWYVYLEDADPGDGDPPNYTGKRSALSIEFGHRVKGSSRRVGGLYIITGAVGAVGGSLTKRWDK